MRNFTKCLILTILISLVCKVSYGAIIFVDQTLSSNCPSENYSTTSRSCTGSDGNAYTTIQSALNAMNGGDDIFMRGGTYSLGGSGIFIPRNKNGINQNNYSSLQSYPGEWAILDGQNNTVNSSNLWGAVIGNTKGLSYWEFGHFEVKNGRTSGGSVATGLIFGGDHGYIHHLYIHDNVANSGSNNPSGLKLEKPQNTIVEYCYLYNNGMAAGTNINASNFLIVHDYVVDPLLVDINNAEHSNEFRYNLIEHAPMGLKWKGFQFLSLSRDNKQHHIVYKNFGDKVHHNIIKDIYKAPLTIQQDFVQVYNNIIDMSSPKETIITAPSADFRSPFFATFYNNTFIKSRPCLYHDYSPTNRPTASYIISSSNIGSPANPFFYFYNNIIENVGPPKDGRNDLNILFTYSDWDVDNGDINMSTVFVERNLFVPRQSNDKVINVGEDTDDYSVYEYISKNWASKLYTAGSTTGLHKTGSRYKTNGSFSLNGSNTVANGGIGISHPYLSGVTIPSYVGATDPDNDSWVDRVLGLSSLNNLKLIGSIYPTSGIASSSNVPEIPPAPTKLMVVE